MEDRMNPNHPGKPMPYRDDAGDVIPGYVIDECHKEFDALCRALVHIASEVYVYLGDVKDPEWLAEGVIERYEETTNSFFDLLLRDDIVEASGLAKWRTMAANAFADAFREARDA